jgi:hypothetical protein
MGMKETLTNRDAMMASLGLKMGAGAEFALQEESGGSKVMRIICALCSLAIGVLMALYYWGLAGNASAYNAAYCPGGPESVGCILYDQCNWNGVPDVSAAIQATADAVAEASETATTTEGTTTESTTTSETAKEVEEAA